MYLSEQSYETTGILLNAHVVYLQEWGLGVVFFLKEKKPTNRKANGKHTTPASRTSWSGRRIYLNIG